MDALLPRVLSGAFLILAFFVLFFRMTRGTGWVIFIFMTIGLMWLVLFNPRAYLFSLPVLVILLPVMWYFSKTTSKRRSYLPPIVSVEGGGIRRGLTAPEAAVLLEMEPGRVITLVVIGLMRKGILRITDPEPLSVSIDEDFLGDRTSRYSAAARRSIVLHGYEQLFIDAIAVSAVPLKEVDMSDALRALVHEVVFRVESYDLHSTRRYYKSIIDRTWESATDVEKVSQRNKNIEMSLEWMPLHNSFRGAHDRAGPIGFSYAPLFLGRHQTAWPSEVSSNISAASNAEGSSPSFTPSFRDVANSFAGWFENTAGQLASCVLPESIYVKDGSLDLSGLDGVVTGAMHGSEVGGANTSSISGASGGGACACAGCACACACAGGGR